MDVPNRNRTVDLASLVLPSRTDTPPVSSTPSSSSNATNSTNADDNRGNFAAALNQGVHSNSPRTDKPPATPQRASETSQPPAANDGNRATATADQPPEPVHKENAAPTDQLDSVFQWLQSALQQVAGTPDAAQPALPIPEGSAPASTESDKANPTPLPSDPASAPQGADATIQLVQFLIQHARNESANRPAVNPHPVPVDPNGPQLPAGLSQALLANGGQIPAPKATPQPAAPTVQPATTPVPSAADFLAKQIQAAAQLQATGDSATKPEILGDATLSPSTTTLTSTEAAAIAQRLAALQVNLGTVPGTTINPGSKTEAATSETSSADHKPKSANENPTDQTSATLISSIVIPSPVPATSPHASAIANLSAVVKGIGDKHAKEASSTRDDVRDPQPLPNAGNGEANSASAFAGSLGGRLFATQSLNGGHSHAASTTAGNLPTIPVHPAAVLVDRLTSSIFSTLGSGRGMSVELSPPEYGRLRVEVFTNDGTVTARLQAETTSGQQLLSSHLSELRDSLQQSGTIVDRVEVTRWDPGSARSDNGAADQSARQFQQSQQQSGSDTQPPQLPPDGSDDAEETPFAISSGLRLRELNVSI